MKIQRVLSIIGVGALLAAGASAETFDTSLASPDTTAATPSGANPSWFNGSGNPQGGWTVNTGDGIELGLRAKFRGGAQVDSPNSDEYSFSSGAAGPGVTAWNYEFSIDLQPGGGLANGGTGSLTLNDVTAMLTVTHGAATATVNAVTYWGDDSFFGTPLGQTTAGKHVSGPITAGDYVAQNSENPGFSEFPLAPFDFGAGGTYDFELDVYSGANLTPADVANMTPLASDEIDVVVTPEPSTFVLLGGGCLALFLFRRRLSNA